MKNGCPWCNKHVRYLEIMYLTIQQLCDLIHGKNKYFLAGIGNNDNNKKYYKTELINLWCGKKNHVFLERTITTILSQARDEKYHLKGCEECLKERKERRKYKKKQNRLARKSKSSLRRRNSKIW